MTERERLQFLASLVSPDESGLREGDRVQHITHALEEYLSEMQGVVDDEGGIGTVLEVGRYNPVLDAVGVQVSFDSMPNTPLWCPTVELVRVPLEG